MSNEAFDLFLKLAILNKHFISYSIKSFEKCYITSSMLITDDLLLLHLMREMAEVLRLIITLFISIDSKPVDLFTIMDFDFLILFTVKKKGLQ